MMVIKIWLIFRLKAEPGSTDKYHPAWPLLDRDSNWRTGQPEPKLKLHPSSQFLFLKYSLLLTTTLYTSCVAGRRRRTGWRG
jgi:hypothetical protein